MKTIVKGLGACVFMGRKSKLTKEQKVQLCKERLDLGIKLSELAVKYELDLSGVKKYIKLYKMHGANIFNEKKRNSTYTKEFKSKVIAEYLKGNSLKSLEIKYNISKTVFKKWISVYNSGKELEDYDPKGEIYTMKSKKYTKEEKYKIAKECIEKNKNYKEICVKYHVAYASLYRWVKNAEDSLENKLKGKDLDATAKLEILLKLKDIEIERLKAENEILKKNEEIMDQLEKMEK